VWNKKIQGQILSAYFYGYLTTQVAGGYASLVFGAKITLAGAIFIGSLFTLLAPLAAQWSWIALLACRFLTGFAHVRTLSTRRVLNDDELEFVEKRAHSGRR